MRWGLCKHVHGFELAHPLDMQEEWNRSHTGDRPAFKQDPKPLLREIIFVSVYSHCQVVEPGSGKYSVVFFCTPPFTHTNV